MARLSEKFRCIAVDMRGFGASEEQSLSFTMDDLAGDVMGIIRSLGVANKVAVCGLSMGGYVAMRFAEMYPESLSRLLLTNTRGNADDETGRSTRIDSARKALAGDSQTVVAPMLEKLLSPRTLKSDAEITELVKEMMFNTRPSTVAWAMLAMANRPNSLEAMRHWEFPTLCIGGEHDKITPPEALHAIADRVPNASVHIDSNSGHMTPLESPDWFAKKVSELFSL